MQNLTEIGFSTSEKHKEMTLSRLKRDEKDARAILSYLQDRSPFSSDISLRSISTGVAAQASANVERAESIGKAILFAWRTNPPSSIRFRGRSKPYKLRQIQLSQLMEKLLQWIHNFCFRDS